VPLRIPELSRHDQRSGLIIRLIYRPKREIGSVTSLEFDSSTVERRYLSICPTSIADSISTGGVLNESNMNLPALK
jgi:hypothetical protein